MFNIVRKRIENKQSGATASKDLTIQGPPNIKGERTTYTYFSASEMAKNQGLLTADGNINGKEFKKRFWFTGL